ncbi:MAG: PAS domain-containing protein, partial [bacterium]|nr:PAS domain-containing protein [bacterium]
MTLRRALVVYLIVLHLLIAVLGGVVLWPESRRWILVLELTLMVSAWVGIYLVRSQSLPDRLASIASEWMRERDFSHALKAEGTADVRRLIEVYNGMVSKLREERLRNEEKEQFLQKVLEASPFGVITTDHDGRVRSMNPAAMTLLEVGEDELLGSSLSGAMKPFVRDLGAIPLGETRLLRIGSQRRVRGSHSRFYDRGFPRSFFQVEDLTQDLWEIEKASYDRVLRTLSHEVNNTLGATSSILESAKIFGTELNTESSDELNTALQVAIDRAANLNTFMRRYAEVVRVPVPVKQAT